MNLEEQKKLQRKANEVASKLQERLEHKLKEDIGEKGSISVFCDFGIFFTGKCQLHVSVGYSQTEDSPTTVRKSLIKYLPKFPSIDEIFNLEDEVYKHFKQVQ